MTVVDDTVAGLLSIKHIKMLEIKNKIDKHAIECKAKLREQKGSQSCAEKGAGEWQVKYKKLHNELSKAWSASNSKKDGEITFAKATQ